MIELFGFEWFFCATPYIMELLERYRATNPGGLPE